MLLALALALRAPSRFSAPLMCADPVGNEQSVDVECAAAHARAKLGPTPDLTPAEVLETMLAAFQRGGDDDVEDLFQFIVPDGDLYTRHSSSAGAMACFRWKIRKEPRWQKVYDRPCAMLLGMRSFEVVGSVMTDADIMLCGVRASPFFPDAPHAEAEAFFEFQLVRQRAGVGSHPDAAAVLGDLADCWMVNDITPDFSAWHVKDPIGAGRAPDTFVPPKPHERSTELDETDEVQWLQLRVKGKSTAEEEDLQTLRDRMRGMDETDETDGTGLDAPADASE